MSEPESLPDADGPNKWLNGVKRRVEVTGDGYVRLPLSDWQGVVSCFEWGEALFGDAREALELIAAQAKSALVTIHAAPSEAGMDDVLTTHRGGKP